MTPTLQQIARCILPVHVPLDTGDDLLDMQLFRERTGRHTLYWLTLSDQRLRPMETLASDEQAKTWFWSLYRLFIPPH